MYWPAILTRRGLRSALRGALRYVFGKRGQRRVHGWRAFFRIRAEMMLRTPMPIPGITRFPAAKLWVDREAFPRIKKLLRKARHTIFIQMFIWKDDRLGREIAELLLDAADRGVSVEIWKEAVGDMFEFQRDFLGTRDDGGGVWKKFWSHPRIRVHYETRNDHAKVYIIDDRIFLLSGMNIANEYDESWHDYLVELRGQSFVEHYLSQGELPGTVRECSLIMNTERRKEIRGTVMSLVASAKKSIVIEQCYFSDRAVIDSLVARSQEGIEIILIIPESPDVHYYANMEAVSRLLTQSAKGKVSVFLFPRVVHGKIILVDRERAFVGSANLMTASLDEMGEVNVLIEGRSHSAIRKLRDVLREDILKSKPLARPMRFGFLWKWLTWFKL